MEIDRIDALRRAHPWLPDDYARTLVRVVPGRRRYGIEWFDGPRRPAADGLQEAWPSAWWIGRRAGNPVGYDAVETGSPALREWGGSQQRVVQRHADIDALVLAQIDPGADRRPRVPFELRIDGLAFGPWHATGVGTLDAACRVSPGLESVAVGQVMERLGDGWELLLMERDDDAAVSVRRRAGGFELERLRHGSFGRWEPTAEEEVRRVLDALAPWNDGADAGAFGRLTVPAPQPRRA